MTRVSEAMIDLAFDLEGGTLPPDYGYALYRAVAGVLPWLDQDELAGIHLLRGAHDDHGTLLLSRRTKLVLRVSQERVAGAMALSGQVLNTGEGPLRVGTARIRPLTPFRTLHAPVVVTGSDDELAFLRDVGVLLEAFGTPCAYLSGRRRVLRAADREITGYSLMLHGISPEQSLMLQETGLGTHRKLGCGIFVPHKSIAAVQVQE